MTTRRDDTPENDPQPRGARTDREDPRKLRVPAEPVEQRPDEAPIGNGGTNAPAAFPPHN